MIDKIKNRLVAKLRNQMISNSTLAPGIVMSKLYAPYISDVNRLDSFHAISPDELISLAIKGQLPIPPANLRMGYCVDSDEEYLRRGVETSEMLKSLFEKHSTVQDDVKLLEWGCATGRVIRWFDPEVESKNWDVWGVDQHEKSVHWCNLNLGHRFRFFTGSSLPHLPVRDGEFDFVYGISVFTHVDHFCDSWLMEMRRIIKRNGIAIFTIHDEHTMDYFEKEGVPEWWPQELPTRQVAKNDLTILGGEHWANTFFIHSEANIRREWSRYFEVVDYVPLAEHWQSAVVLRSNR